MPPCLITPCLTSSTAVSGLAGIHPGHFLWILCPPVPGPPDSNVWSRAGHLVGLFGSMIENLIIWLSLSHPKKSVIKHLMGNTCLFPKTLT